MTELDALRSFADAVKSSGSKQQAVLAALADLEVSMANVEPIPEPPAPDPAEIRCPRCGTIGLPLVRLHRVVICGSCGASLVNQESGAIREARFTDVETLTATERLQLVQARASIARADRKAGVR